MWGKKLFRYCKKVAIPSLVLLGLACVHAGKAKEGNYYYQGTIFSGKSRRYFRLMVRFQPVPTIVVLGPMNKRMGIWKWQGEHWQGEPPLKEPFQQLAPKDIALLMEGTLPDSCTRIKRGKSLCLSRYHLLMDSKKPPHILQIYDTVEGWFIQLERRW